MKIEIIRILTLAGLTAVLSMAQPLGTVTVDLTNGAIFDLSGAPIKATGVYTMPYATVQTTPQGASCPETPFQAKVSINMAPPNVVSATRVRITVDYAGPSARAPKLPTGWVTHIGDDNFNDGFGGGSGLTNAAEVQIVDQNLAFYSSPFGPGQVDRLAYHELRLAKGALQFDVANQYFSWGQPFGELMSPYGKKLFEIGSPGDNRLYVGLNRVVSDNSIRTGCGAKRATLVFIP